MPFGLGIAAVLTWVGLVLAPGAGLAATASGTSLAATPTKAVRYHGYRVVVPRSWPVYRLASDPTACVRFDRHAVYLGRPSADQRCPATVAAGRTEAILVSPLSAQASGASSGGANGPPLPLPSTHGATPASGSAAQIVKPRPGVVVTATWDRHPSVIAHALGVGILPTVAPRPPRKGLSAKRFAARAVPAKAKTADAPAQPGAVYTGLGFDACSTPSTTQMNDWEASSFRAIGVYIGGTNMACSQPNLNSTWVAAQSSVGWHLVPIYVGLQAPGNSCGCAAISAKSAASQGSAAANDAITEAQSIGLAPGNPLYFDMEGYDPSTSTSSTVLNFLAAWTTRLHASGYKSGVYSSAASGIRDLAGKWASGYVEPDDIWIANWNGAENTADPNVPSGDWASHQRLHQYQGGHNATYGGATINIDSDYVDASTAAAGSATPMVAAAPSLSVSPQAGGAIDLSPSWTGAAGISRWQALGGASPTSMAAAAKPVRAGTGKPIVVNSAYKYFEVQAIGASGQAMGNSPAEATPAHLAIVGKSAFVPVHGKGGLPVECFRPTPCSVTTTVSSGKTTYFKTGAERIPVGGGVVYFGLSSLARQKLAHAVGHKLAVKISVRDASGVGVSRSVNLVQFTTSGRGPVRSLKQASTLKIIGATDFVSNGWSGGILAECLAAAPCSNSVKITSSGKTIATAKARSLGVSELGYLSFTLTATGHRLLALAHGNQLGATLTLSNARTTVRGRIVLDAFH
ncbi:MAG: DUF1906 domain-containing protein [Solirubrobacteraceae bacterium]